uniref:Uncharacterized protein n=1 Tax=Arundo donax TaxID=35708 RepID=A0A0A9BZ01_ARUDO
MTCRCSGTASGSWSSLLALMAGPAGLLVTLLAFVAGGG